MNKVLVLGAMIASASFGLGNTSISSYTLDKVFTVTITDDALQFSPAWDLEKENPPLSARKAIGLASAKRKEMVKDSEEWIWRFTSAALHESDNGRW